ncbi:MAG: aminodeoxychorismate lyase [Gammaproteobacteria bacterium]|nr:aminodeoxychorismate lyase [Gammaproteobacteria bacterium]
MTTNHANSADQPVVLINGSLGAAIACDDRGLHYGDGLFETLAVVNGVPQHWSAHLTRLNRGCVRLGLNAPPDFLWRKEFEYAARQRPAPPMAALKLILTRGAGRRGYAPPPAGHETRILQLLSLPESTAEATGSPFVSIICNTPLGLNPILAGLKHLNRLEQVLGAQEVARAGADEGIMFDLNGRLIAGTRSNVFIVRGEALFTPRLAHCGVHGVMRDVVVTDARERGLSVSEEELDQAAIITADELFFTNSLIGIQPANSVRFGPKIKDYRTTVGAHLRAQLQRAELAP